MSDSASTQPPPPQRRRHHADGLEQLPAHAQEFDLQGEPEHEHRPAFLDHAAFGRREVEERLDLEGGQLARQALEPEAGLVCAISSDWAGRSCCCTFREGHNNGQKTANSNRLIRSGNPRLAAGTPEILPALYRSKNKGTPDRALTNQRP